MSGEPKMMVRLHAQGMRCHSCEEKLSAWLGDIEGVESVQATYATGRVTILADECTSIDAMLRAVVDAGFVPGAAEIINDVHGMAAVELSIEASKQGMHMSLDQPTLEAAMHADYPAAQRMLSSEDAQEGPRAFAEKRKPKWQGN